MDWQSQSNEEWWEKNEESKNEEKEEEETTYTSNRPNLRLEMMTFISVVVGPLTVAPLIPQKTTIMQTWGPSARQLIDCRS